MSPVTPPELHGFLPWKALLSLVAIGTLTTATSIRNGFTQDDLPLILANKTVHSLESPWRFVVEPYWNDPFPPALYRPLATATHAVQWAVGDGSPRAFRLTSVALLFGAGLALFGFASLLLPRALAWSAAALFLAHPVHVEATALAVNQGELAVGTLLCLAIALYIRARRRGALGTGTIGAVSACYLAASLFKENGLILPGLLLVAELTVITDPRSWRERYMDLRPAYLFLVLVGVLVVAARTAVLGGDTIGTPRAEVLAGSGPAGRMVTMLGVIPHWLRLLFWPAELQADYGPDEIAEGVHWGFLQWLGLALLVGWATMVGYWRRRRPVLAFALLWIGVAILPVSNVIVPTGVILAERTLFLASAGAALFIGGLMSAVSASRSSPRESWRLQAALAVVALLVGLGVWRSWVRNPVWRDQEALLRHTAADAPRSYAAHLALARFLSDSGAAAEADPHFREAAAIEPTLVIRERAVGDRFRLAGYCRPALRRYRLPLLVRPEDSGVRAAVVECLLQVGRFEEARLMALPGLQDPAASAFFRRAVDSADSALVGSR